MLRDGKQVSMETGNEHWNFCLVHDDNFGEEVLSVKITKRDIQSVRKKLFIYVTSS